MAYDAAPPAEVTARDRMIRLRDFLAQLRPEDFDMSEPAPGSCGTPACISGWAKTLFAREAPRIVFVQDLLGLDAKRFDALCLPDGWRSATPNDPYFSVERAVAVLDHYLATGEIDWSVAKLSVQS